MKLSAFLKLLGFDASAAFLIGVYLSGGHGLIVGIAFISGLAAIGFALAFINQSINEASERRFTSGGLLKSTIYLAIFGILFSVLVINYTHADPTGVFTVTAEGLGFIGLSLVELTIFLGARKTRPELDLALHSNTTRKEITMSSPLRLHFTTHRMLLSPYRHGCS